MSSASFRSSRPSRPSGPGLIGGLFRTVWLLVVLLTPLLGTWFSSSLAAARGALLLFPVLPLAWELRASAPRPSRATPRTPQGRPGAQAQGAPGPPGPSALLYLQEVARSRLNLENEVRKLMRLLAQYGQAELLDGMAQALAHRTLGTRYVRALMDQARFARGLAGLGSTCGSIEWMCCPQDAKRA